MFRYLYHAADWPHVMNHVNLDAVTLEKGAHQAPGPDGEVHACVMEMVAYFAHEPWSDTPKCASSTLTSFLISWNDYSDDEQRQELKRYIPRLVNSKGTKAQELKRSWMAFDWLVRVQAPAWLRLAGLTDHADTLANAKPLTNKKSFDAIREGLAAASSAASKARAAAWAAAWDAARAAAWAAAWDAARAAAWAAAWEAAWDAARAAAGAAAWDATWDATGAATGAAAGAAAGAALAPTVAELRLSAHELVERMLAVTE